MRFYNMVQLQLMVEFQHGELLIWGLLLSLNVAKMGDFEESAQETIVRFDIHVHIHTYILLHAVCGKLYITMLRTCM
jgi:hypothetical protein